MALLLMFFIMLLHKGLKGNRKVRSDLGFFFESVDLSLKKI